MTDARKYPLREVFNFAESFLKVLSLFKSKIKSSRKDSDKLSAYRRGGNDFV
jgi:hypothetical protein